MQGGFQVTAWLVSCYDEPSKDVWVRQVSRHVVRGAAEEEGNGTERTFAYIIYIPACSGFTRSCCSTISPYSVPWVQNQVSSEFEEIDNLFSSRPLSRLFLVACDVSLRCLPTNDMAWRPYRVAVLDGGPNDDSLIFPFCEQHFELRLDDNIFSICTTNHEA